MKCKFITFSTNLTWVKRKLGQIEDIHLYNSTGCDSMTQPTCVGISFSLPVAEFTCWISTRHSTLWQNPIAAGKTQCDMLRRPIWFYKFFRAVLATALFSKHITRRITWLVGGFNFNPQKISHWGSSSHFNGWEQMKPPTEWRRMKAGCWLAWWSLTATGKSFNPFLFCVWETRQEKSCYARHKCGHIRKEITIS